MAKGTLFDDVTVDGMKNFNSDLIFLLETIQCGLRREIIRSFLKKNSFFNMNKLKVERRADFLIIFFDFFFCYLYLLFSSAINPKISLLISWEHITDWIILLKVNQVRFVFANNNLKFLLSDKVEGVFRSDKIVKVSLK